MPWPDNQPDQLDQEEIDKLNERFKASDQMLGIKLTREFQPFTQRNDIFTRAFWDRSIRNKHTEGFFQSYRTSFTERKGDGFSRKDFALRNAAWAVSSILANRSASEGRREGFQAPIIVDTPIAETRMESIDPAIESQEIKQLARLFGADLVGITEVDLRWHYASRVDSRDFEPVPNDLPDGISHVIVMGHAMDAELVKTYPSALAGASSGLEYSNEAAIVTQLASYIRHLGYEAIASMNDTALVIPYAIKAGLGEYGRNQMLLTPEYGPRVRFSKIFTNLPLLPDTPEQLGIRQYCELCHRCADACPPKALPFGPPTAQVQNRSTITGVVKWSSDAEKCFGYWAKLKTDCAICMRVCPFGSHPPGMASRLFNRVATSRFRKLAFWWESRRAMPARLKPAQWWRKLITR